jgi:Leucine-rich repeat (LRR) protein
VNDAHLLALQTLFAAGRDRAQQAVELLDALEDAELERALLRFCTIDAQGMLQRSALFIAQRRPDLTETLLLLLSRLPGTATLEVLNLDGELMEQLPPEIGRFGSLKSLSLRDTRVRQLCDELWGLPLDDLDLSGTELTEIPGLSRLSLTSLVLGRGASWQRTPQLTVAPDLSAMPLERLVLHNIGAMPDLSSLNQLCELDLSLNPFTTLPPLGEPPLVSFVATDTQLRRFPMALTKLDTLEAIDLARTTITEVPISIRRLWRLRRLSLAGSPVRTLPESLRHLRRLEVLDVSGTRLKSAEVDRVQQWLPDCFVIRG